MCARKVAVLLLAAICFGLAGLFYWDSCMLDQVATNWNRIIYYDNLPADRPGLTADAHRTAGETITDDGTGLEAGRDREAERRQALQALERIRRQMTTDRWITGLALGLGAACLIFSARQFRNGSAIKYRSPNGERRRN